MLSGFVTTKLIMDVERKNGASEAVTVRIKDERTQIVWTQTQRRREVKIYIRSENV